jgi:hypothetical protein
MTTTEDDDTTEQELALGLATIRGVMLWHEVRVDVDPKGGETKRNPTGKLTAIDLLKKPPEDMAADFEAVKELAIKLGRRVRSRERAGKTLSSVLAELAKQVVLGEIKSERCAAVVRSIGGKIRVAAIDEANGGARRTKSARASRVYSVLARGLEARALHRGESVRGGVARGELGALLASKLERVAGRERDGAPGGAVTLRSAPSAHDRKTIRAKAGDVPAEAAPRRRRKAARDPRPDASSK